MNERNKAYHTHHLTYFQDHTVTTPARDFVSEDPLLIRVEDTPYSVVMRTPGHEIPHAAGFCFSEGLVESPLDFASIGFCSDLDANSVTVRLTDQRKDRVADRIERGGFLSQTSCGICGREMIEDLTNILNPVEVNTVIHYRQVFECVEKFSEHQKYYNRTRGTHAVMLFDSSLEVISRGEDVGRHNAMDKAVGGLFLEKRLDRVHLAVLTSRMSFEMVQKAARARIPILISLSNPTSMAVEMGERLNMTLVILDKKSGFIVPCGEKRIMTG